MRSWWIVAVLVTLLCGVAHSSPYLSPRIATLAAKPWTVDEFWNQVEAEGTPIVENVFDPQGRVLVTFVYRAGPAIKHVALYHVPSEEQGGYAQMERIPGTNVFAWSAFVEPTARFTYALAPGDDLGPPIRNPPPDDGPKRTAMIEPDPLDKAMVSNATSIVELPRAPAQPWLTARRESPAGTVVVHDVKSKSLGNTRPVWVYTPPGFSTTGAPYPLVVMFDGDAAIFALGITFTLDNLIAAKRIPPCVVVMIGNTDRGHELPHDTPFADFVALDVVPWIRHTYHATEDPRLTVIQGLSYGGIASSYAAFRHPEVYGNVLSQSGSYWWSADEAPEPETHAGDYIAGAKLPLRFWMEVGTLELGGPVRTTHLAGNRHFRDVLRLRGYDMSYREFVGAHEYINWRGSIADGLIALLSSPPRFTDKLPAPVGAAGGIDVGAAKPFVFPTELRMALLDGGDAVVAWLKQQDPALSTEDALNGLGYWILDLEHPREAIPIFAWVTERFPKSWNAFDSLGDAYRRAGDRARAIESYERSLALNPKNPNLVKRLAQVRETPVRK
jgi:enterochelin esterase-like enzyme